LYLNLLDCIGVPDASSRFGSAQRLFEWQDQAAPAINLSPTVQTRRRPQRAAKCDMAQTCDMEQTLTRLRWSSDIEEFTMNNVIYIVGLIVIVVVVLGYFGLR